MNIREIDETIEEGDLLKQIAQVYSDMANLKIKRIRANVERNRSFFEEISYVYGIVRVVAARKKVIMQKSKKTISLILTSNYRFYGKINLTLIDFFTHFLKGAQTDILLIGKTAIDYFKTQPRLKTKALLLKKDYPQEAELNKLVEITKDYSRVLVFYSKMKSLLIQIPEVIDLSTIKQQEISQNQLDLSFIFEPDLQKILAFFDSQIITLILEEAFLESELSRAASRFISMDQAETAANKFIDEYRKLRIYTKRSFLNNQLLESLGSQSASRKKGLMI